MKTYDSLIENIRQFPFSYPYYISANRDALSDCWIDHYATFADVDVSSFTEPFDEFMMLGLNNCLNNLRMNAVTSSEKLKLMKVWERLQPWPETTETLKVLQKKYKLGVLSNGSDHQLKSLVSFALPGVNFTYIFGSTIPKCFKPNKLIYKQTTDMGFYDYEILHIAGGRADVAGAKSFGIFTGLNGIIDDKSEPFKESNRPCIRVDRIAEFIPILIK